MTTTLNRAIDYVLDGASFVISVIMVAAGILVTIALIAQFLI